MREPCGITKAQLWKTFAIRNDFVDNYNESRIMIAIVSICKEQGAVFVCLSEVLRKYAKTVPFFVVLHSKKPAMEVCRGYMEQALSLQRKRAKNGERKETCDH